MRKKPDLLFILVAIFTLGVAISGYTHSQGFGAPELPSASMSLPQMMTSAAVDNHVD